MSQSREIAQQIGRGSLNFLLVLALLAATIFATRGRIPNVAGLVLSAAVVLAGYLTGSIWIEKRSPPELHAQGCCSEFGVGFILGVLLFCIVMGILGVFGLYHPTHWGSFKALAAGFLVALCQGVLEEVLVRGFIFRLFSLATGTWIALVLSAALFGLLHAANPGATAFSTVAIALEAGVLLAAAYVVSGRLWLPIGLHAAWNVTEGSVFGMSVSGGVSTPSLIAGSLNGPALLTGGAFGPEASVIAVIVCLMLAVVLLRRAVRENKIAAPAWKTSTATTPSA
jgi:uncharacterized protein